MENLWSYGAGPGAWQYPDYGKYVPKHYFKVFLHVLPLLWAPQEYWFCDQCTRLWEVAKPLFLEINKLQRALTYILYLVLDETISGFRRRLLLAAAARTSATSPASHARSAR